MINNPQDIAFDIQMWHLSQTIHIANPDTGGHVTYLWRAKVEVVDAVQIDILNMPAEE
jgi:hypothetical protein